MGEFDSDVHGFLVRRDKCGQGNVVGQTERFGRKPSCPVGVLKFSDMTVPFKFGCKPEEPQAYAYPNIWSREKTSGSERLVVAPDSGHIALMQELSSHMAEPFGILYVLGVPRGQGVAGRYQCPEPVTRPKAAAFLKRFEQFFESDGRHHVWLASVSSADLLVYDKHNVIYVYGQLSVFEDVLQRRGLKRIDSIRFPDPHIHNYNPEFDKDERQILQYWDWKHFPLQESDD